MIAHASAWRWWPLQKFSGVIAASLRRVSMGFQFGSQIRPAILFIADVDKPTGEICTPIPTAQFDVNGSLFVDYG
jgi:hypothetical protein